MSPSAVVWLIAGGVFVIIVSLVAIVCRCPGNPESDPPATRERGGEQWLEDLPVATVWFHSAPPRPFPPDEAQRVMQDHRACDAADCPRKLAAVDALIRSGRMKPPIPAPGSARGGVNRRRQAIGQVAR